MDDMYADKDTDNLIYDVFVTYSFSDGAAVSTICSYLEKHGLRCFIAERDMPKGSRFASIIPWAIEHSRIVIAVASQQFNDSIHTSREIVIAADAGIPIITIKLEGCNLTNEKQYYLSNITWIDAMRGVALALPEIESTCRKMLQNLPPRKTKDAATPNSKKSWFRYHPMALNSIVVLILILLIGVSLFFGMRRLFGEKKIKDLNTVVVVDTTLNKDKKELEKEVGKEQDVLPTVKTDKESNERKVRERELSFLSQELEKSLQQVGPPQKTEIDSLMYNIVVLSKESKNVGEKMKVLETAIEKIPKTHKYIEDRTKDGIARETLSIKTKDIDKINIYMGILYYYGIASDKHVPNPEIALEYFNKSSIPISKFYRALCRIKISDNDTNSIRNYLNEVMLTMGETLHEDAFSKYFYLNLGADAEYYYGRASRDNSVKFNKEREDYYLTETNKNLTTNELLNKKITEIIDRYKEKSNPKYTKGEVSEIMQAAEKLEDGYNKAYALNELGYCYHEGNVVYEDKTKAKRCFQKAYNITKRLEGGDVDSLKKKIKENINRIK